MNSFQALLGHIEEGFGVEGDHCSASRFGAAVFPHSSCDGEWTDASFLTPTRGRIGLAQHKTCIPLLSETVQVGSFGAPWDGESRLYPISFFSNGVGEKQRSLAGSLPGVVQHNGRTTTESWWCTGCCGGRSGPPVSTGHCVLFVCCNLFSGVCGNYALVILKISMSPTGWSLPVWLKCVYVVHWTQV